MVIILLPVSIPAALLSCISKYMNRQSKNLAPLQKEIRDSIKYKLVELPKKLGFDYQPTSWESSSKEMKQFGWYNMVMHYAYLNVPNSQRKTDNYLALFDFLRALTFIGCIVFDYLFFVRPLIFYYLEYELVFDIGVTFDLVLLVILCNILFWGFVKFYRRFTIANYMALLTEKKRLEKKRL